MTFKGVEYKTGDIIRNKLMFLKELPIERVKKGTIRYGLFRCSCGKEFKGRVAHILGDLKKPNNSCGCVTTKINYKIGETINGLLFLGETGYFLYRGKKVFQGLFKCICGKEFITNIRAVKSGNTGSCGCLNIQKIIERSTKHGMRHSPEYTVFSNMKTRCYNPKATYFEYYGGRGIKMCDRWLENDGLKNFIEDMGLRPSSEHTLDRIDVNGGYCKDNCRWVTMKEQSANRRSNVFIEFNGQIKLLYHWAQEFNINHTTLKNRLNKGLPMELAIIKDVVYNKNKINSLV